MEAPDFLQLGIDAVVDSFRARRLRLERWTERRVDDLRERIGVFAAPLRVVTKADVERLDRRLGRTDVRVRRIQESRLRG
jgi:hypothetical protein